MVRVVGVLIALLGLLFVGASGTKLRAPRNYRLPIGLGLMAIGILIALLATQIALTMGWQKP